jgi:hypothetical protein
VFIRKSKIKDQVLRARKAERKVCEREFALELDRVSASIREDHSEELAAKDAEMERMEDQYKDDYKQFRKAEDIYRSCWHQIHMNVALAAKLSLHATRIHNMAAEVFQVAKGLLNEANIAKTKMEHMENLNRSKLKIPNTGKNKGD